MGTFSVEIEVGDPSGSRFEPVEALVDTGATYTMLPASMLRSLDVSPIDSQSFILTNGQRVCREIGQTLVSIDSRVRTTQVVFADEESDPVLGMVTLGVFGLRVDPIQRCLVPVDGLLVGTLSENDKTPTRLPVCRH